MLAVKPQAKSPAVFIFREVSDGQELVDLAREISPDLIITDNCMSEMSGGEAILKIRRFNGDVPIIMVSADIGEAWMDILAELNAEGIDKKSLDRDELLSQAILKAIA